MMQYNLTNPSDPYTFEAPDLECAALVAVMRRDYWIAFDVVGREHPLKLSVPHWALEMANAD